MLEEATDLARTFTLFHGPSGIVPLSSSTVQPSKQQADATPINARPAGCPLPLASMSLSGVGWGSWGGPQMGAARGPRL